MIGTVLNAAGILVGGIVGLTRRKPLSPARESFFKVSLGALTVYYGLHLTWISISGSLVQVLKQVLLAIIAMMLGKLTGRLLRLQKLSNHLGRHARDSISSAGGGEARMSEGFKACTALFCAAPLGILGAVQDGISEYSYPLGIKAVMDGLAAMGFVSLFGWGVMLSILPVVAFQGTITLLCAEFLKPFLTTHGLIDSVNAVGGLLVFSVALVILGLKKIELADYLPSLIFAPLLAWFLR